MKFRVDAQALVQALKQVKAGLASQWQSTSPYVVIDAKKDGTVVLATWNASMRVVATVSGEVEQEGTYAVLYEQIVMAIKPLCSTITLSR
jgi:DNA polymerase III sliding clamp (beta) subunit (PCNA family)